MSDPELPARSFETAMSQGPDLHLSPDDRRLAAVMRSVADAIVVTDEHTVITLLNPAAEKLLATPASRAVGQRLGALHAALGGWLAENADPRESTPSLVYEFEIGLGHHFSASLSPVRRGDKQPAGWVVVVQDVTHLKQAEQWKSETIQAAAHDLRDPLNLMIGSLNLLRDLLPDPTPEQAKCLAILKSSSQRMMALTEQLLKLEQIEAGADLTLGRVALRRMAGVVVDEFQPTARDRGVALEFEGGSTAVEVTGDEGWLHRAAANLVSNALKYTPTGGRVRVRCREAEGEGLFEVTDTGPGIPVTAQSRLFERFYRVRSDMTQRTTGSGLGLAIVKTVVERHSGRVWVSSDEGHGSTFGFAVPLANGQ